MTNPMSLRNIPPDILRLARATSVQTGLSVNAVFRLALASGLFVELTKIAPDQAGTYGGLQATDLAKALRRHLSSAIDFLLEQGQHPYQGTMSTRTSGVSLSFPQHEMPSPQTMSGDGVMFDRSIGDDLEALGIGMGLSESAE
jgi:hypothetical protein